MSECVTHHHACECREARLATLEDVADAARGVLNAKLCELCEESNCFGTETCYCPCEDDDGTSCHSRALKAQRTLNAVLARLDAVTGGER